MFNGYNVPRLQALFKSHLLSEVPALGKNTIKNYVSDVRHFLGWLHVNEDSFSAFITEEKIEKYRDTLFEEHLPETTINRRLSTIRKFCSFLVGMGELKYNPSLTISNVSTKSYSAYSDSTKNENAPIERHEKESVRYNFNLVLALSFISVLLFIVNAVFLAKLTTQDTEIRSGHIAGTSVSRSPGRVITFKGKLYESRDNPIFKKTDVEFKLYNSPLESYPIYSSGYCSITPNLDGAVEVFIGGAGTTNPSYFTSCGKEIPNSIFNENTDVYLGVNVGTEAEMKPRKRIPNTGLALEAESLKGYVLGTDTRSIPFIDDDGAVHIRSLVPGIKSENANADFSIQSEGGILLEAREGSIKFLTSGIEQVTITSDGKTAIHSDLVLNGAGIKASSVNLNLQIPNTGSFMIKDESSNTLFSLSDIDSFGNVAISGNLTSGTSITSGTTTVDIGGVGSSNHAVCHSGTASQTDNVQLVDCGSTPTADFAEMYPVEENVRFGDVVSLSDRVVQTKTGESIRKLKKSDTLYDKKLIGVVSNNYGDFITVGYNIDQKDNPLPVALKGRVPVKIAPSSAPVLAGDYLTSSSSYPGMAEKAKKPGYVIGKALEDWNPSPDSGSVKKTIMIFIATIWVSP